MAERPRQFVKPSDRVDLAETYKMVIPLGTVPTAAGNTGTCVPAPSGMKLLKAYFSGTSTLATDDTNFVTFSIVNTSNSNAALLAATDPNTTKTTGGAVFTANTPRELTLGTDANLVVRQWDNVRVRVAGSGTLANTIPESCVVLIWAIVPGLTR